jgi:hypothetical protein
MSAETPTATRLRSSLASAAWAVEDRVVWGGADAAKRAFDAAKWPFERFVWTVERHLVWPLQDRTDDWNETLRAVGAVTVVVVAIGAGVLGLVWAAPNGGDPTREQAAAPSRLPFASETPLAQTANPAPILHGAQPVFKAETGLGTSEATGAKTKTPEAAASGADTSAATASATGSGEPAGPAALKVARRFADAFVLYEIGKGADKARTAFHATATPELAHSLLRRPPRLPAGVKVPKAKVVNVVAGPSHGGVYPVSVSLLRVGVTNELRLDMQKQDKAAAGNARPDKNNWQVTDVTG